MPKATKELNERAYNECDAVGLHPLNDPLGCYHHTDVLMSEDDEHIGSAIAWYLGGLFVDVDEEYFYRKMTSVDVWQRVVRALRIHGLKIVDAEKKECADV